MGTITMWAEISANVPNVRNVRPSNSTSKPASVNETDARTVIISPDDVAKIRKDAEDAICLKNAESDGETGHHYGDHTHQFDKDVE